MIRFQYPATFINYANRFLETPVLYGMLFPEHLEWLKTNDCDYDINCFFWPEMMVRNLSRTVCEFEITFENEKQAIMFSLFSGMTNDP